MKTKHILCAGSATEKTSLLQCTTVGDDKLRLSLVWSINFHFLMKSVVHDQAMSNLWKNASQSVSSYIQYRRFPLISVLWHIHIPLIDGVSWDDRDHNESCQRPDGRNTKLFVSCLLLLKFLVHCRLYL